MYDERQAVWLQPMLNVFSSFFLISIHDILTYCDAWLATTIKNRMLMIATSSESSGGLVVVVVVLVMIILYNNNNKTVKNFNSNNALSLLKINAYHQHAKDRNVVDCLKSRFVYLVYRCACEEIFAEGCLCRQRSVQQQYQCTSEHRSDNWETGLRWNHVWSACPPGQRSRIASSWLSDRVKLW